MSPRRWSYGFGGLTRPPFLVGVAIAALLALGACSSAGSGKTTTTGSSPVTTVSTELPTTSSTSPTTSTTIAATTTLSTEQDLLEAWASYWNAWAEVRASEGLDPGPLEAVAAPDVVDGALTLFERQRSSGLGPVQTEVVLHPTVVASDADRATVEDCVLLAPSFTDNVGVWHRADLVRTEQGWVVDVIRIPQAGGCVPEAMAEAAIAAYKAYYQAEAEFWNPPNPLSPLLDDVLTEPQKSFIVDLLEEHEAQGVALRGQPTTHPEVIELRSPSELVILSCSEPDPNYGLYDIDSDERLPDEPVVREGQRDLQSAVMVFEGGTWKISDLQGQVDFACDFAPTERGLPSV